MVEPVTIEQMKAQVRVDHDDDDAMLVGLIVAARRSIENRIGRPVVGADANLVDGDADVVRQAVLLLAATWYANREAVVTGSIASSLPLTVEWLITPLARMSV